MWCRPLRCTPAPAPQAKTDLKQKGREFHAAESDGFWARFRLARAQGKLDAEVCRALLRLREAELKTMQGRIEQGTICCNWIGPLQDAEGSVAVARAWLAEAENDEKTLRTELPKGVAYYERRIQRYKELLDDHSIDDELAARVAKEIEPDLQWARDRLGRLSAKSGSDKP